MHRHRMSSAHDRPSPPRTRPPGAELLPVLVWLNRRELASRFPAWQHAANGEHEGSIDASPSLDGSDPEPPR